MLEFGTCSMSGMGFGFGWIYQIVIFIVFFLVVWWLLKNKSVVGVKSNNSMEKPLTILKRRLANGEISKKEYESLKKEIE